jgi:hypothetical protein
MDEHFQKVKDYLLELELDISHEDEEDGVFVINQEDAGIKNMIIGLADPILVMEQYIISISNESEEVYRSLLQKNRDIISGAFVLDETGTKVIFRDTLALENLDLNEVEESLNSLTVLLSEYSEQILKFSKN